ncbi:hypothetical protein [Hymenobacter wooponensis]|uniref:Lipoprotein n=1 Tax=Hymenobacter wooponensis TaxID=1525360 RepID=A0A4Z0MDA4_9BACT|nr:hypothetical protein [Hymenobacter wooponensis]TGD77308.1 hypothetical protein EU557_23375 [Hymenobacter wooponensis]
MKNRFTSLALGFSLLLAGCGDKREQPQPTPSNSVVVEAQVTAVGSPGSLPIVALRETSLKNPGSGKLLWGGNRTTGKYKVGTYPKGKHLFLHVLYEYVNRPNYVKPTAGQSIKCELLLDGKVTAVAALDASSFDNQALYFQENASLTHVVDEVEVVVQ